MRYRRLSYRYAMVLAAGEPRLLANDWRAGRLGVVIAQPRWRPPADVYETATTIHVTAELAGVNPDDLEVLLYEDALIVEGRRDLPPTDPQGVYHAAEIRQGPFRLELPLPAAVDLDRVEARYEQGLIHMSLVKSRGERHGG
jgi:HSP20 family molecular chaperone IbpA